MCSNNWIHIKGARENNLKNVNVRLPKKKLIIFTGVSGSGKSSLVFDTIAAESQRQLNETYNSYIRHRLPHYGKPDVDEISNLSVAVIVDQKRIGGNARSTVGTITDINPLLRLLFSRVGKPFVGYSNIFSFNHPQGMCPHCEGLGKVQTVDIKRLIDKNKSLNQGAISFPTFETGSWRWSRYTESGLFDNDKALKNYSKKEWSDLLYGEYKKLPNPSPKWHKTASYEGLIPRIMRTFLKRDSKENSRHSETFSSFVANTVCPNCQGTRLNPNILSCKIQEQSIADCCAMQVSDLLSFIQRLDIPIVKPVLETISIHLQHLIDIGLQYLSLDRETSTLSGGESQRVKMVKHLGSSLTDLTYIFDEPTIGLHPADVYKTNQLLKQLRDKENTVLVVEHDPDVMAIADMVVDMGPMAGAYGGKIMYQGEYLGLLTSNTLTGQYLSKTHTLNQTPRQHVDHLQIEDAAIHNLKHVSVAIPKKVLTVITGVAGSGKSSLIRYALIDKYPDIILIDQSELRGSKRSNIATYTGVFDSIRQYLAKANQVSASLFSTNSKGACPECKGLGEIYTDLAFMDPMTIDCDVCQGTGYKPEVLRYKFRQKNISDILSMTIAEAEIFFQKNDLYSTLQRLSETGLGYITLGQPLNTLSGGERQRVKLASELKQQGQIYVFDEPSTGLHVSDVAQLIVLLNRLVDQGSTVIVIEHNLDIISQADWLIDMGPGGGKDGGEVVFEGRPAGIMDCKDSLTGKFLKRYSMV